MEKKVRNNVLCVIAIDRLYDIKAEFIDEEGATGKIETSDFTMACIYPYIYSKFRKSLYAGSFRSFHSHFYASN